MELQAVDVERAIELIEEKGWIRGDLETRRGYCAIGAVRAAVKGHSGTSLSRRWEMISIGNELALLMGFKDPHWTEVVNFNDARGRTKEEVLERLTLAAKKLRELGR